MSYFFFSRKWVVLPAVILAAAVLFLLPRLFLRPEITGLDSLTAGPGDKIEITGRHFGRSPAAARLYAGNSTVTFSGIIEWEKNRITARLPRNDGAVLIRVKTRFGTSNGVILGDSERFPEVDYGAWLPGSPYIEYAEPAEAHPGSLVTFHGSGFGNRKGSGRIWVNRSDESSRLGMEEPDVRRYVEADVIELWSDTKVQFRVPEGARGGSAYLYRSGSFSNPVSIEAETPPGQVELGVPVQWSLRQEVVIDQIGAFPGNTLYLRVPVPHEGMGQGKAVVLYGPEAASVQPVRQDSGLTLYRLEELRPGESRKIERQMVVPVRPVRVQVDSSKLLRADSTHPVLAESLISDAWLNPKQVSQVASGAAGASWDSWRKSRALYNYVIKRLEWNAESPAATAAEAVKTRQGDSETYSFLFCSLARSLGVPARPVGGLIVLENGESRKWWWAEVWMEGVGWVPLDPALGDFADGILLPGGPSDKAEAAGYYFGGLEGRHIAFSRGIRPAGTQQPHPELRIPSGRYTLQELWEESSGNLESYMSFWPVPRVTASYPM
ncbi:MAG: hypothetical protein CSA76_03805 [Spirochaetales bacterium]|nr:MAG: hypothetical protein CSA76_03805 [Spirochaetales bacterium]